MERKVDFVVCDMPSATPFMLHVYAAVAEEERRMIAKRTKDALAAAKARGQVLGNVALAKANHDAAAERAEALRPVFAELAACRRTRQPTHSIAATFRHQPAPRGRQRRCCGCGSGLRPPGSWRRAGHLDERPVT
jgi:DNA invertase Pin-like site-specific DNA recombinase